MSGREEAGSTGCVLIDPEKLFANIEKAGLQYDSSWGWADQLGFRNGAAFAFPPYNFTREEPYNFLSIPLVIMDQGLQVARRDVCRSSRRNWPKPCCGKAGDGDGEEFRCYGITRSSR